MKKLSVLICILFLSTCFTVYAQGAKKEETKLIDPTTNCELRYYYFPNIEAFFDTKKSVYIYNDKGVWITAEEIPSGYRGYSMYNKASVFIKDYDGDDPVQYLSTYKKKFPYNQHGRFKDVVVSTD